MRTEMSVVSQSDMYEGANMSNKGLRMSNSLVRISSYNHQIKSIAPWIFGTKRSLIAGALLYTLP